MSKSLRRSFRRSIVMATGATGAVPPVVDTVTRSAQPVAGNATTPAYGGTADVAPFTGDLTGTVQEAAPPLAERTAVTGVRDQGVTGVHDQAVTGVRDQGVTGVRDQGVTGVRDQGVTGVRVQGVTGVRDQGVTGVHGQAVQREAEPPAADCAQQPRYRD